jgi:uncharacterized protein YebE (UPF0316 family)
VLFSLESLGEALIIFALRVSDMSLDTLRMFFVMRGRKSLAWVVGFFQALVFVIAITRVLGNLDNPLTIVSYAAGFATGNVVGMLLEERLAIGHIHLRIISPRRGSAIASRLREEGYAVTEIPARGKDGMVTLLNCSVFRRNVIRVDRIIQEVDEEAFVTAEEIHPVWRGFWRA